MASAAGSTQAPSQQLQPSLPSGLPFHQSHSRHVLHGASKGVANASLGLVTGIGFMIAAPITFGVEGYKHHGVLGAFGGSLLGLTLGTLGGVAVVASGMASLLYQTALGVWRTPRAVQAWISDQDWDDDAQAWAKYDLTSESQLMLHMTEEEFKRVLKETGSLKSMFSAHVGASSGHQSSNSSSAGAQLGGDNTTTASTEIANRPKKNVADRELYDLLAIEPEATPSEIKKAYYLQAKKSHPDRNPDNPQAKEKFQKIGQAYQILSDESLRLAYDTKGKSSMDKTQTYDAGMLYTVLFGSENFEPIIGELYLSNWIKAATEEGANPPEMTRFRQRKRELQCAVLLASKLDLFVDGDVEAFAEKAKAEADELAEFSLISAALTALIGSFYIERATSHLSTLSYISNKVYHAGTTLSNTTIYFSSGLSTVSSALGVRKLQLAAEAKQEEEDKRNNVSDEEKERRKQAKEQAGPMESLSAIMGPSPSAEEKEQVQTKIKKLTSNVIVLLWQMTKSDIQTTLRHVCNKVLRDHSVTPRTIELRAQALLMLGKAFYAKRVSESQSVEEFLEKMGKQSGLFGEQYPTGASSSAAEEGANEGESEGESGTGSANADSSSSSSSGAKFETEIELQEALDAVQSGGIGVKDLKEMIVALGGDPSQFLEKSEMKQFVTTAVLARLEALAMAGVQSTADAGTGAQTGAATGMSVDEDSAGVSNPLNSAD